MNHFLRNQIQLMVLGLVMGCLNFALGEQKLNL
jgi:hypothetical protein